MPLIQSDSRPAFKSNLKAELAAGKPRAQSLAIAFAVQRRNRARGGPVRGYDGGGMVGQDGWSANMRPPGASPAPTGVAGPVPMPIGAPSQNMPQMPPPAPSGPMPVGQPQNTTAMGPVPMPTGAPSSVMPPFPPSGAMPSVPVPPMPVDGPNGVMPSDQQKMLFPSSPGGAPGPGGSNGNMATPQLSGTFGGVAPPVEPMNRPLMSTGGALERASGGFNMAKGPHISPPWQQRNEIRGMTTGPILSAVPGRTDRHSVTVPGSSYVLPSQHVASLGQGNTIAGFASLNHMFGPGGPYGSPSMKISHGSGAPHPPRPMKFSDGGSRDDGVGKPTPVILSGGEFVIDPESVRMIGKGSIKEGHKILDAWVMSTRRREIATQKKLPPPAKK